MDGQTRWDISLLVYYENFILDMPPNAEEPHGSYGSMAEPSLVAQEQMELMV